MSGTRLGLWIALVHVLGGWDSEDPDTRRTQYDTFEASWKAEQGALARHRLLEQHAGLFYSVPTARPWRHSKAWVDLDDRANHWASELMVQLDTEIREAVRENRIATAAELSHVYLQITKESDEDETQGPREAYGSFWDHLEQPDDSAPTTAWALHALTRMTGSFPVIRVSSPDGRINTWTAYTGARCGCDMPLVRLPVSGYLFGPYANLYWPGQKTLGNREAFEAWVSQAELRGAPVVYVDLGVQQRDTSSGVRTEERVQLSQDFESWRAQAAPIDEKLKQVERFIRANQQCTTGGWVIDDLESEKRLVVDWGDGVYHRAATGQQATHEQTAYTLTEVWKPGGCVARDLEKQQTYEAERNQLLRQRAALGPPPRRYDPVNVQTSWTRVGGTVPVTIEVDGDQRSYQVTFDAENQGQEDAAGRAQRMVVDLTMRHAWAHGVTPLLARPAAPWASSIPDTVPQAERAGEIERFEQFYAMALNDEFLDDTVSSKVDLPRLATDYVEIKARNHRRGVKLCSERTPDETLIKLGGGKWAHDMDGQRFTVRSQRGYIKRVYEPCQAYLRRVGAID